MNELLAYGLACLTAISIAAEVYILLWVLCTFEKKDLQQSYKDKE